MKNFMLLGCCYHIYILIYLTQLANAKGNFFGDNTRCKETIGQGCFCKLSGTVDDCECKVENADYFNNLRVQPLLHKILQTDYFRYFKVNLNKKCPFWYDDHQCSLKDCAIDKCKMDEIPIGLKENKQKNVKENKYSEKANTDEHSCEEKIKLAALDKTISDESKQAFQSWSAFDDAQMTFCEIDDELSSELDYVDLLLNPERYTGYKGRSPHRIWNSIYNENCFKPHPTYAYGSTPLKSGFCLEKRVFYRMISGLHTSINIHLSAKYLFPDTIYKSSEWGMNAKEFKRRFDPETTAGEGPQWLKNLYFTYLVELRAIAKAAPYLEMESFYTGNETNDIQVKEDMKTFLDIVRSFNDHFDESKLFQGDSVQAKKLKSQFQIHFRNISRIMDCVGCDKCKLWGKLQVQGMGTALKILFSGNSIGPDSVVNADEKNHFQLRRTEIVSLINAFGRLSESIKELNAFRNTMT
ncbi:ERO1-like protein alpha isoform X2 [Argonauta hians]